MKHLIITSLILLCFFGCKQKTNTDNFDINAESPPKPSSMIKDVEVEASKRVELDNKGIGPIKTVLLDSIFDQGLISKGSVLFQEKCTICHKANEDFIGPTPKGITQRRSPEWIMNMILNPDGMVKEDPLARDLFMEYNGSPMANQGLSESEARAILEYFRTL